jgi:serine/threonine-protein kinase
MDYCEGGTLRHLLEGVPGLSIKQGCELIMQILAGLSHAQLQGIIHCDIKPENILLTLKPAGWVARISDFGIARVSQDLKIGTGSTGSPAYMAPERFYGQYHLSADLYAVGILLFEMLTGERPFSGTPVELMTAHLNRLPQIPDSVPDLFKPILKKSLEKLPARRFQSAAEMLEALQSVVNVLKAMPVQLDARPQRYLKVSKPTAFQSVWQQPLAAPLSQLTVVHSQPRSSSLHATPADSEVTEVLYQSSQAQVYCNVYTEGILRDNPELPMGHRKLRTLHHNFEFDVYGLVSTVRGCFILTRQKIYQWALEFSQPPINSSPDSTQPTLLPAFLTAPIHCVQEFVDPVQVAIATNGQWFAAASHPPGLADVQITVGKFTSAPRKSQTSSTRSVTKKEASSTLALECSNPTICCQSTSVSQLLILDSCHGLALCQEQDHSCLELFNRRGQWLGALPLGVSLERCVLGYQPYQLLGVEVGCKDSLLVIDLKPMRMHRLSVPIVPTWFAAMSWGYVIVDAQAQIVLLDIEGEILGQIKSPFTAGKPGKVTALTTVSNYGLLLALWQASEGSLHGIDVRELDVDLLF